MRNMLFCWCDLSASICSLWANSRKLARGRAGCVSMNVYSYYTTSVETFYYYLFYFLFFCSFIPFRLLYLRTLNFLFSLLPTRNSDPGSHSRLLYPLPATVHVPSFLSREDFSLFFPCRLASNEGACLPTLQGALNNWILFIFSSANKVKSPTHLMWGSNPGLKHKQNSRLTTWTTGATGHYIYRKEQHTLSTTHNNSATSISWPFFVVVVCEDWHIRKDDTRRLYVCMCSIVCVYVYTLSGTHTI